MSQHAGNPGQNDMIEVHLILDRPGHDEPANKESIDNLWWAVPLTQLFLRGLGQGEYTNRRVIHNKADPPGLVRIEVPDYEFANFDKQVIQYGFHEKYETGDENVTFWLVDWDAFLDQTFGWAMVI